MPLPYEPEQLRIRIDESSSSDDFGEHHLGQLLVSADNGLCIAAEFPDLANKNYRNVANLKGWKLDRVSEPRFAFNRWALSVVDEAGQWVDLVKRDSSEVRA